MQPSQGEELLKVPNQRFDLALERISSGDWVRFEKFASQFLVQDLPALRTVASPSGDLGRDSELFSPDGDPKVLLQYSVTEDWPSKIRSTAKRVRQNFKDAVILIYVSNQVIGAKADGLKKDIRSEHGLVLDIYDRSWFLERATGGDREKMAERLAEEIVDPYLASRGVIESKAPALKNYEAKAAVLYLQLQFEDDSREKGLTKLSFDALVKSVLRETTSEKRMSISAVCDGVKRLLPSHHGEAIDLQVNATLLRLYKRSVRIFRDTNEVCLIHDEVLRVKNSLVQKEIKDSALDREIRRTLADYFSKPVEAETLAKLCKRTRRLLDTFLLQKGEEFASAVAHGINLALQDDSLDVAVANDFAACTDDTKLGDDAVSAIRLALHEILLRSNAEVQNYLREIADGYNLFAFLQAVPDVQKAMQKVFRDGEIWLDSSVLLPVLAETLLEPEEGTVTRLLDVASDAGMKLFVTSGMIEEVERHINKCIVCVRAAEGQWIGNVPFLLAIYALTGSPMGTFPSWSEKFRGAERPLDDIAEYLDTELNIKIRDLDKEVEKAPKKLRWEIERIWREAHESRRGRGGLEVDASAVDRLVDHDVECFLGVIGLRSGSQTNGLGYSHWWLTFDKTVRDFERKLAESLGRETPKAPIMSPDFLANYLAVGPVRERLSKTVEANIPVAILSVLPHFLPAELIKSADDVRKTFAGADERLIRRKLRDALDLVRRKRGEYAEGGLKRIRENIESALRGKIKPA